MKNQFPALTIPKTAKEAYEVGYLDYGGEFQDDVTGASTVVRSGYFDFEADGGAPQLRVPYTAQITFGIPHQPRTATARRNNVIVMPFRKAS